VIPLVLLLKHVAMSGENDHAMVME